MPIGFSTTLGNTVSDFVSLSILIWSLIAYPRLNVQRVSSSVISLPKNEATREKFSLQCIKIYTRIQTSFSYVTRYGKYPKSQNSSVPNVFKWCFCLCARWPVKVPSIYFSFFFPVSTPNPLLWSPFILDYFFYFEYPHDFSLFFFQTQQKQWRWNASHLPRRSSL